MISYPKSIESAACQPAQAIPHAKVPAIASPKLRLSSVFLFNLNASCARLLALVSVFIGLMLGFSEVLHAAAGDCDPLDPGISGGPILTTVVQPDGRIIIGGYFTSVMGVPRNRIARINADGTLDSSFDPNANGGVESIVVQTDGKIILGGYFTTLQPGTAGPIFTRRRIARLNADGTLDAGFDPNANLDVLSIAGQADGKIVIVGRFSTLQPNGTATAITRNRVARLNADGTLDTGFSPSVTGDVYSLAIQADGKILIVGNFLAVGSSSRNRIARLNANGTLDTGFNPNADNSVNSIAVQADGKILVGGDFIFIGSGVNRNHMARLNANGTVDTGFNPNANDRVYSMAVQADGKILIAGYFTTLRPTGASTATSRNRVARLNANGTLDMAIDPNAGNVVNCVALQADGRILVAGSFTTLQPNGTGTATPRAGFARLYNDPATEALTVPVGNQVSWSRGGSSPEVGRVSFELSTDGGASWTPLGAGSRVGASTIWQINDLSLPASGWIRALGGTSDGNGSTGGLIASTVSFSDLTPVPEIGVFTGISTAPADERLNNTGTHLFASTAVGESSAAQTFTIKNTGLADLTGLALSLTGANPADFTLVAPTATLVPGATTTFTVAFSPTAIGVRNAVVSLTSNDSDENPFVVSLQGTGLASKIATLSALSLSAGVLTPAFDPATTSYSIDLPNLTSSLTVTPTKTEINASIAVRLNGGSYIAVTSGSASDLLALNAGANPVDVRVTAQDGKTIKTYTVTVTRAGAVQGSLDSLEANGGTLFATAVQTDGKIILAGALAGIGGVPRNNIARLNADGTLDAGFDPNANGYVINVALQPDGKILVVGNFTSLQPNGAVVPITRNYIARLNSDGTLDGSFDPNANGFVRCAVLQPDGKVLLGGEFTTLRPNGAVMATARNRIARVNADGTLDSGFDPNANSDVNTMALQPDGKVLLGGYFTTLQPNSAATVTSRNHIARVNSDGALDTDFDPNANGTVNCAVTQPDGKILLGGGFTTLQPNGAVAATIRNRIARLNSDGTLDSSFDPNANDAVYSMAVQTDGSILLGGEFTTLQTNGAPASTKRNRIARLKSDGSLDVDFDPNASNYLLSVALQADGKVLIGGIFDGLQPNGAASGAFRSGFARLLNDAASQSLTIPDASRIEWLRSGASPELEQVTFEISTDSGTSYTLLGAGTRINSGWKLTGLSLPNGLIRARGRTTGGYYNGAGGMVETVTNFGIAAEPEIAISGNNLNIPNGDASPDLADHTDFGNVTVSGAGSTRLRTFTVANTGASGLFVGNVTISGANAADFTVIQQPSPAVAPGRGTTFTISFDPGAVGLRSAVVSFNNDDADENPFQFCIQGTGFISGNADLSALKLSVGSLAPAFSSVTTTYTTSVVFGENSLTVTPTQVDANASIQVRLDGGSYATVPSGSASGILDLKVGNNIVDIRVTAQDGITIKIYTVTVTRTAAGPGDLDPLDAHVSGSSSSFYGSFVYATAIQPDGKTVIAGNFTSVQGVPRNNIARLNADGSLDMGFDPKTNNYVFCVAVQDDGKLILGGWFTTLQPNGAAAPTTRNQIARINPDGTLDGSFDPNANSHVLSLAVQADGKILLCGYFTTLQPNGAGAATTRNRIARLYPDGTLDAGFNPNANAYVSNLAVQADGKVLFGGYFTTLQPNGAVLSTVRNRAARVNADGTLDADFNPNANDVVNSMAVQPDGKVLLGGNFTTLQPTGSASAVVRRGVARILSNGTLDSGFDPNVAGRVYGMALQTDRRILVVGGFVSLQPNGAGTSTTRNFIARLHADGTVDPSFNPSTNGNVNSVALQSDGQVLLGGEFYAFHPNGAVPAVYRTAFARILNAPATQLLAAPEPTRISWARGGSSPEVSEVTFELSTDGGGSYSPLGNAARIGETPDWQLTGLSLPASGMLRARGRTAGPGSGLVETVASIGSPGTPIEIWRQAHFGSAANTGNGADAYDFDHDGLVNLIEYAFGLDPAIPDAGQLGQPQRTAGNMTFTFTTPPGVSGITYGAEWSGDLDVWTPAIDLGTAPQHLFNVPMAGKTSLFMRLSVTAP